MKRNLFSWLIYDVANSFLVVSIGGLFLGQWVILDNKFDDIWYGAVFVLSTIVLLLTSPLLGGWSDKTGRRLPFLKRLTALLIIFNGALVIFALSNLPNKTKVFIVLGLTLLIQYIYQLSLILHNALLERISTEKNRGRISGLGEAFNNFGWIAATAFLILFSTGKITLFGEPGREQAFFPAFVVFTLLSLPILFLFREEAPVKKQKTNIKEVYSKTVKGLKELFKNNKNIAWFLIAFSLISDMILTIQLYFAVVMDSLYHITDNQKFSVLALMFSVTIAASYILGRISDRVGNKIIIMISGIVLVAIFLLAFLSSATFVLWLLAVFAGIGWAGYYTASRSMMIKISPPNQLGEYFGLYSAFQRFASITGPLLWGIITIVFRDYGEFKYKASGISLIFVMIIGIFILKYVREEKSLTTI